MARVKSIVGLLSTYLDKNKTLITAMIKQILRMYICIEYEKSENINTYRIKAKPLYRCHTRLL